MKTKSLECDYLRALGKLSKRPYGHKYIYKFAIDGPSMMRVLSNQHASTHKYSKRQQHKTHVNSTYGQTNLLTNIKNNKPRRYM
jgi:hypothetical protein